MFNYEQTTTQNESIEQLIAGVRSDDVHKMTIAHDYLASSCQNVRRAVVAHPTMQELFVVDDPLSTRVSDYIEHGQLYSTKPPLHFTVVCIL